MSEGIIIQLIIGTVTIIACIISNYSNSKKQTNEFSFRLSALEKKVEKHNNLLDRMTKVETEVTQIKEMIKK